MANLFIIIALILIGGKILFDLVSKIRTKKIIKNVEQKIINRKQPKSLKEALNYKLAIERSKPEGEVGPWGTYFLFQFFKNNNNGNSEMLDQCKAYGETIKDDFKEYSFYDDAVFTLANIYFFETFELKKARDTYQYIIDEKPDTRWKNICKDRIELIQENIFDEEALKLFINAEKYFEDSKYEDAQYYLKEIIKKYPDIKLSASALFFLGDISYYKFDDLDKALEYYKMTAKRFPEHNSAQKALYKVGEILRKKEKWKEAIEVYREYINKYRNSSFKDDAYFYIGECYQHLGKMREAKNAFSLILGDYPDSKWTDVIYHKLQYINKMLKGL